MSSTVNNVANKVKEVKQFIAHPWEDTKDAFEEGLTYVIEAKETVAEGIQQAAVWWEYNQQWRYPQVKDISISFNTLYFIFHPIDCTIKQKCNNA